MTTQTNSFNGIIRQVTEHANPRPGFEKLITIDARTGQAVSHTTFFGSITGDYKYFLVSNISDGNKVIKGTKQVKYKEGPGEVFFAIEYEGGCQPGHESWFAERYFKSARSEEELRNALAKWLIEYFSRQGRRVDDFLLEKSSAAADLKTRAGQEFGFDLAISLKLEGEDTLGTIEDTLTVSTRLRDFDEEKRLTVKIELVADQHRILRALLNKDTALAEMLTKGVRTYFADRVTLDIYYHGLETDRVRDDLAKYLDTLMLSVGRRVEFLSLQAGSSPPLPFRGQVAIEYPHHEYPDPIKINVDALIRITNEARYRAKGSPPLNDWLERNLNEIIPLVLFGVPYVELLLDFQDLKDKIDDLMKRRAEVVGGTIEQLMTIVFLEPFEWLKRIDLEIKNAAPSNGQPGEAMFETSLANFHVGLEIFLTARLRDLRGIQAYLTTKQNVPQRIKEEIVRLVRRFLHGTDPERFYMRYSEVDKEKYPDEQPFETELRNRIQHLLDTEFNAEVIDLVLKPLQTDITRKLESVSKRAHDFAAAAELGVLPAAPTILIKGSFRVVGVCDWKTFRDCEIGVDTVKKRIEDSLRAFLRRAQAQQMIFEEHGSLEDLTGDALLAARTLIGEEFGLAITLTTVYWEWEDELKKFARQERNKELVSIRGRVARLKERLLDLYENGADDDAIQDVLESIRRLSSTLPPALAPGAGIPQMSEPTARKSLPVAKSDDPTV